jgi:hypothetical protein
MVDRSVTKICEQGPARRVFDTVMALEERMMEDRSDKRGTRSRLLAARIGWRWPLLAAALVLGLTGRIAYSYGAPLWFDETFTGVIASQPTFAGLVKWCMAELTGPGFYAPLWAWEKLAGPGNFALRLPSLILSICTPLAILRWGARDFDLRLWWTVVLLLWVPIFAVAGEARPYPEIFALGAGQAIAFIRMIERPTIARTSGWIIVSSLLILCHYWSVVPAIVQGLAFLAVHRFRAIKAWPALVFLAPMLIWSWFHLPAVLAFTAGGGGGGMPLSSVLDLPAMLLGVGVSATIVLAAVMASLVLEIAQGGWRGHLDMTPERVLAWCGVVSVAVIFLLGFALPGFSRRYAMAAMPSFLFALALWARWMTGRNPKAVFLVVAMLLATAAGLVGSILLGPDKDPRHMFELERPSAWLGEQAPEHLIVFWDGPVAEASPEFALAGVGGFFLRRDGHRVDVSVARVAAAEDPNRGVLALTDERRKSAILWFANDALPPSRTPRIEHYDPRYECRDFGGGIVTMTACRWRR